MKSIIINLACPSMACLCQLGYAINMPSICHQYAINMPSICHQYAINMPSICHQYAINMPSICYQYAINMISICHQYAVKENFAIFLKQAVHFAGNLTMSAFINMQKLKIIYRKLHICILYSKRIILYKDNNITELLT